MSSNAVSLKRLAAVMPSNIDKHSVEDERPVSLCNYVDVYKNERITDAIDFMEATATDAQIARFTLQAHDVLVTKDSEEPTDIGIPAYVPEAIPGVVCGYHLAVIRPEPGRLHGAYLHWALQSAEVQTYYATTATGISRYALGIQDLGMTPIHLPSLTEQEIIANFLDEKTARIDALIAEKERLVEALEELRASTVDSLICERLSGHPQAMLGLVASYLKGKSILPEYLSPSQDGDAIRYLRMSDYDHGALQSRSPLYVPMSLEHEGPRKGKGDALLMFYGFSKDLEASSLARASFEGEGVIDGNSALVRSAHKDVLGRYLAYLHFSSIVRQNLMSQAKGSIALFLDKSSFSIKVPIPPLLEQTAIVRELDALFCTSAQKKYQITLITGALKEYRSSLISAAVTGQLNIDEFQARQLEAA